MNRGAREEEKDAQMRFLDLVSWGGGTFELEMLEALQVGQAFSHQPGGGFRSFGGAMNKPGKGTWRGRIFALEIFEAHQLGLHLSHQTGEGFWCREGAI